MEDKNLYQEKFEAKLKELKAQLDFIEAKAAQAKAQSKIELQKQLQDLRRKRDAMRERLDKVRKSSGGAWKDLKAGVESAADDLKEALGKVMDKFK
jgi:septation ring formation regulator EzrA